MNGFHRLQIIHSIALFIDETHLVMQSSSWWTLIKFGIRSHRRHGHY